MASMNMIKKRIIISMCALILLIITLIGITYAYFTAKIQGNEEEKSIAVSAGSLKLLYGDGNKYIEVTGIEPGTTIKSKTFTVENVGDNLVDNYDVILEDVVNELEMYEDLTYVLECSSSDSNKCIGSEGTFPKGQEVIATNSIDEGVIHSYILTLTYHETNTNQSKDMNKTISAKVNIKDDVTNIKTLKIYGNSVQDTLAYGEPTPTNPVEIQSLGDKTKNLFDISKANIGKNIDAQTGNLYNSALRSTSDYIEVDPSKQYTLVYNSKFNVYRYLATYDENKNYLGQLYTRISGDNYTAMTIEFTSNEVKYMRANCVWNENGIDSEINDFIIYEGSGDNSYEPYGYKIPITLKGKNLINPAIVHDVNEYIVSHTGVAAVPSDTGGIWRTSDFILIEPNTTYHFNAINNDASSAGIAWYDLEKNYISGLNTTVVNAANGVIVSPNNAYYLRVSWRIEEQYNPNWQNTIQLELGDAETNYESYKENIVNIYLDEPLRKIGDYADYIDFENRKVVRSIYHKVVTGTESIYFSTRSISFINISPIGVNDANIKSCVSNYYKSSDWESLWRKGYGTSATDTQGIGLSGGFIRVVDMINYPNADKDNRPAIAFKTHLANLYSNSTPLIIDYVLSSKTEEMIKIPQLSINEHNNINVCDTKGICASKVEVEFD